MPNFTASVTAAVAVVDADVFDGETFARSPVDRVLSGFAYTGSAVVGDSEVEVFVDEVRIGSFFNSKLLTPDNDDLIPLEDLEVPSGAQLRCVVKDAAATSPVFAMAALQDV